MKLQTKLSNPVARSLSPHSAKLWTFPFKQVYSQMTSNLHMLSPYTKKERFLPGNYRLISLLNSFSKIIEKIVHQWLYSFLKFHGILYKYQFGFREGHSTILALTEITEHIYDALDKRKICSRIVLRSHQVITF